MWRYCAFGALVPVLKKRPGDLETPSGREVPKYRETRAPAAQKYKSVKHKICKGFTVVKLCNNLVSQISRDFGYIISPAIQEEKAPFSILSTFDPIVSSVILENLNAKLLIYLIVSGITSFFSDDSSSKVSFSIVITSYVSPSYSTILGNTRLSILYRDGSWLFVAVVREQEQLMFPVIKNWKPSISTGAF